MDSNSLARRIAWILWWSALALVAAGAVLLAAVDRAAAGTALIGGGLAALGLNLLLGGELIAGPAPRTFNARGQVVRGELVARCGLCDLAVGEGPSDRVAAVQFGPLGKPDFQVDSDTARLLLRNGLRPNIARWKADLASNVLWDIDARSGCGDLALDLGGLRLERVSAHTALGRLRVICPPRGYVQLELGTTIGVIEVLIPPETAARVTLHTGALASVTIKNERLLAEGQSRYTTAEFEQAASQSEIAIRCTAGDVLIA